VPWYKIPLKIQEKDPKKVFFWLQLGTGTTIQKKLLKAYVVHGTKSSANFVHHLLKIP
jgi:hypothetical protein